MGVPASHGRRSPLMRLSIRSTGRDRSDLVTIPVPVKCSMAVVPRTAHNALYLYWARILFVLAVMLVLYTTLFPFDSLKGLERIGPESWRRVDWRLIRPDAHTDIPRNIALYMPVGFAWAAAIATAGRSRFSLIVGAIGGCACLSSLTEILQIAMPERAPSAADVVSNTLGAAIGLTLWLRIGRNALAGLARFAASIRSRLSPALAVGLLIVYSSGLYALNERLAASTAVRDWNPDYPLALGNEPQGDRAWRGSISHLFFYDRALSKDEVSTLLESDSAVPQLPPDPLVYYPLNGPPYADAVSGAEELSWHGETAPLAAPMVGPMAWLQTREPARRLISGIDGSSQFAVGVTVASSEVEQAGPARIVTLSADPNQRNLTLGQSGPDLSIRLRTPATGLNGTMPQFIFPDVFSDRLPHRLVVSYDGFELAAYADSLESRRALKLRPSVTLVRSFLLTDWWEIRLGWASQIQYQILSVLLLFTPLGLLLAVLLSPETPK